MTNEDPSTVIEQALRKGVLKLLHDANGTCTKASLEGNDTQFLAVCTITSLIELNVNYSSLTDNAFRHIEHLPRLKRLSFAGTNVTGFAYDVLKTLPYIEEVRCNPCRETAAAAKALAGCPSLQVLELSKSGFQSADVQKLLDLPVLEELLLSSCKNLGNGCFENIARSQLKRVVFSHGACGDETCRHLSESTTMDRLSISDVPITGCGIGYLGQIPGLKSLLLGGMNVGTSDLRQLGTCPNLRELSLLDMPLDNGIVEYLLNLPKLEELFISDTKISESGRKRLMSKPWSYFYCE